MIATVYACAPPKRSDVKWLAVCVLIGLAGCGWQPAGDRSTTPVVATTPTAVHLHVGQVQTLALPQPPAGATRTATAAAPAVAAAGVNSSGNVIITGLARGTTIVSADDSIGTSIVAVYTFAVTVTP